jgi:hypothetical protein
MTPNKITPKEAKTPALSPQREAIISLFLILIIMNLASASALAATFIVNNTADNGEGSLRAALASATNGDTIDATGISGTINLTTGELLITNNIVINGPGSGNLIINGNYPNTTNRIFDIQTDPPTNGVTVNINGLTISNGYASDGGAISSYQSDVTFSNCVITGNKAQYSGGGMLSVSGPGGSAKLTLINCMVTTNSAGLVGGAIYNSGESGSGTIVVLGSTISGNSSGNVGAGAIKNDGSPTGKAMTYVTNSTLSFNSTTGNGGAIQNDGFQSSATLVVVNSTLYGNVASADGSSLGGGAIFNNDGGNNGTSAVTIINSTLTGNSTGSRGGAILNGFLGGGVTTMRLLSSTLSDNSSPALGAGIYNIGLVEIGNTILKAGASGSNISGLSGIVISDGYNLSSDSGSGFMTNATDRINIDPMIGPLQDNGGLVFTHALLAGSPAIDQGKNLSGDVTDARGLPRTFDDPSISNFAGGDGTDIGGFEKGSELRIISVEKMNTDLVLGFASLSAVNYEVQTRTNLSLGSWISSPGIMPGSGSIIKKTLTNALTEPQQYYRIHQLP